MCIWARIVQLSKLFPKFGLNVKFYDSIVTNLMVTKIMNRFTKLTIICKVVYGRKYKRFPFLAKKMFLCLGMPRLEISRMHLNQGSKPDLMEPVCCLVEF